MNGPPRRPAEILLAFDFGRQWIGIAIGNTVSDTARALENLRSEPIARRFQRIGELIAQWSPDRLLVGLPLDDLGGDQPMTTAARRFSRQLEGRFARPVVLVDERYSSLAAQADMHGPGRDDAAAATIILRQYLDEQSRHH